MPEIPEAHTYGGIVINMDRKVLLVEPTGHFGGYSWTFPVNRRAKLTPYRRPKLTPLCIVEIRA